MWGAFLSEPLPIVGTVGRYPAVFLMGRVPIPGPRVSLSDDAVRQPHPVLIPLSGGCPGTGGRLHTRYSPVRRSPASYCYDPLPLDLHVLGLSLAFILSQDQTLRCMNCFSFFISLGSVLLLAKIDGPL